MISKKEIKEMFLALKAELKKHKNEPRYLIKEIPIPKEACIVYVEGASQEQLLKIVEMGQEFNWPNGTFLTNRIVSVDVPRFSVAELKKISKSHHLNHKDGSGTIYALDQTVMQDFIKFIKENPEKVQEALK